MIITEVIQGVFRVEIPLQDTGLKHVNSYVIRGPERHLVVDTGDYHDDSLNAMLTALHLLKIDLAKTDFFITHYHVDHIGAALRLANQGSCIYINRIETRMIDALGSGELLADIKAFFLTSGFPEEDPERIVPPAVTKVYKFDLTPPFRFVTDGDIIRVGDFDLVCITTPGHSAGHTCLYESGKKVLLSGDHLLGDITPSIQGRNGMQDPLREYLSSFKKIRTLNIDLIFPGHKSVFTNHKKRIREIEEHHRVRNEEIISILESGGKCAYEVASLATWNVECESWGSLPILHSYFATEETFVHLIYLEQQGRVRRSIKDGQAIFTIRR